MSAQRAGARVSLDDVSIDLKAHVRGERVSCHLECGGSEVVVVYEGGSVAEVLLPPGSDPVIGNT
jgi:hypothetical protein